MESRNAKVISITRGARRPCEPLVPFAHPGSTSGPAPFLSSLHHAVLAVLVAREGKWEVFERDRADASLPVLARVSLTDLLLILDKSAAGVAPAGLADVPAILQAPRRHGEWPLAQAERITVSPWQEFDLVLMIRDGRPCYAACLEPGTSIYVSEETVQAVARFFDASAQPNEQHLR